MEEDSGDEDDMDDEDDDGDLEVGYVALIRYT